MAVKKSSGKAKPVKKSQGKRPVGRPRKEVDEKIIIDRMANGATTEGLAADLGIGLTTLEDNFRVSIRKGRALRNTRLREAQFEKAMGGHAGMMVWLGKQFLGQSDKVETRDTTDTGRTAMLEALAQMEPQARRDFMMQALNASFRTAPHTGESTADEDSAGGESPGNGEILF